MTHVVNSNETPSLLELAEAYQVNAGTFGDLSAWYDEPGIPSHLIDLALCADEGNDGASDIRLKTDIEQVGTTVYGLPLYHFRYKTGSERFEGVMAQDVLDVMPGAVVLHEDGYYRVKYGRLGIRMIKV